MGAAENLQRLELTVDLGPRGRRAATLAAPGYAKDDLRGRQVVCVLDGEELLVVGAHSHAHGIVLLTPAREVEDGATVA